MRSKASPRIQLRDKVCPPCWRPEHYNCAKGHCVGKAIKQCTETCRRDWLHAQSSRDAFWSFQRRTIADVVKSRVRTDATS